MRTPLSGACAIGALALSASLARGQVPTEAEPPPIISPPPLPLAEAETTFSERPAIERAFEITVGGAFTRGLGDISRRVSVSDLARSGGEFELKLGARVWRYLTVGAYGTASGYDAGEALGPASVWGASAGLYFEVHFIPADSDLDPWIGFGGGWRGLFISPEGFQDSTQLMGFDIARIQAGIDLRVTPTVSISPYVTGGFTQYIWVKTPFSDGFEEINLKRISGFISAGVIGRFNIGAVFR